MFKEKLILDTLQTLAKLEEEGTLPNAFYEASITLIPKPEKDTAKKENYRPVSFTNNIYKILNKIEANESHQHIKRMVYHDQVRFIPQIQDWSNICKSTDLTHHVSRIKGKIPHNLNK